MHDAAKPAQVVDTHIVEPQLCGRHAQRSRHAQAEVSGRVTDANHPVTEDGTQGFRDQAYRIGEVDEQGAGCEPRHGLRDPGHYGHGPQRERDTPGARRLLSDGAGTDGYGLVDQPTLDPADAYRAVDDVRILHRFVQRRGGPEWHLDAEFRLGPVQDTFDAREPRGIDIVQHDLVIVGAGHALGDRAVDDRRPEPARADDDKLHGARY